MKRFDRAKGGQSGWHDRLIKTDRFRCDDDLAFAPPRRVQQWPYMAKKTSRPTVLCCVGVRREDQRDKRIEIGFMSGRKRLDQEVSPRVVENPSVYAALKVQRSAGLPSPLRETNRVRLAQAATWED